LRQQALAGDPVPAHLGNDPLCAVKVEVFGVIVKGRPPRHVDEGFLRGTVGEDHIMGFGFNVVNREGVGQFGQRHPINRRLVDQRRSVDDVIAHDHAVITRLIKISVITQSMCGNLYQFCFFASNCFLNGLATNPFHRNIPPIGGAHHIAN